MSVWAATPLRETGFSTTALLRSLLIVVEAVLFLNNLIFMAKAKALHWRLQEAAEGLDAQDVAIVGVQLRRH